MTIGFRVTNPSTGHVQIDDKYYNLCLRSSGVVNLSRINSDGEDYRGLLTISYDTPYVAFSGIGFGVLGPSISSGGITYSLWSKNEIAVSYYIFDTPEYGQSFNTNYGIRIRNPSTGKSTFDSRMKYLRIISYLDGNFLDETGYIGSSISFPGKSIGVIPCDISWEHIFASLSIPGTNQYYAEALGMPSFSTIDGGLNIDKYGYAHTIILGQLVSNVNKRLGSYAVVDLTGF